MKRTQDKWWKRKEEGRVVVVEEGGGGRGGNGLEEVDRGGSCAELRVNKHNGGYCSPTASPEGPSREGRGGGGRGRKREEEEEVLMLRE